LLNFVCLQDVALGRICDSQGRTPLHLAARGGHVDTMAVLLVSGLDIKAADKRVTLVCAAPSGSFEAARFIIGASEAVSGDESKKHRRYPRIDLSRLSGSTCSDLGARSVADLELSCCFS